MSCRDITGFKKPMQYNNSFLNPVISRLRNLNTGGCSGNGVYTILKQLEVVKSMNIYQISGILVKTLVVVYFDSLSCYVTQKDGENKF